MSRDPIGYEGSEWNLYEYVDSSPINQLILKDYRLQQGSRAMNTKHVGKSAKMRTKLIIIEFNFTDVEEHVQQHIRFVRRER